MPTLRDLVSALQHRPDVAGAVLLGRDGLLVDAAGLGAHDAEHLAALVPGVAAAIEGLAGATGHGALQTAILEGERGLALVTTLGREVLLVVLLAPDADPAPLVQELRRGRAQLATLV